MIVINLVLNLAFYYFIFFSLTLVIINFIQEFYLYNASILALSQHPENFLMFLIWFFQNFFNLHWYSDYIFLLLLYQNKYSLNPIYRFFDQFPIHKYYFYQYINFYYQVFDYIILPLHDLCPLIYFEISNLL